MKKTLLVSLFLFWAVVVSILTAGLVLYNNNKNNYQNANQGANSGKNSGVQNLVLSAAEVAKHATVADCWMIISGRVYDFTSFIPRHPGGTRMVPYCGKDGTVSFLSGPPHVHSSFAVSLLSDYLLGGLNSQATITLPSQNPNFVPLP